MLRARLPAWRKACLGMFTHLMLMCAFCGTCGFRDDKGMAKFLPVAPTGVHIERETLHKEGRQGRAQRPAAERHAKERPGSHPRDPTRHASPRGKQGNKRAQQRARAEREKPEEDRSKGLHRWAQKRRNQGGQRQGSKAAPRQPARGSVRESSNCAALPCTSTRTSRVPNAP